VAFSVFDVVLMTGLPTIGKTIQLGGDEVMREVGEMVRGRRRSGRDWRWVVGCQGGRERNGSSFETMCP